MVSAETSRNNSNSMALPRGVPPTVTVVGHCTQVARHSRRQLSFEVAKAETAISMASTSGTSAFLVPVRLCWGRDLRMSLQDAHFSDNKGCKMKRYS